MGGLVIYFQNTDPKYLIINLKIMQLKDKIVKYGSIVLYNSDPRPIKELLTHLDLCKIFIVDNSPVDALKNEFSDMSMVEYIFTGKNIGYGAAHNLAIRKSIVEGAKYHVIMNPDISVPNDCMEKLESFMEANSGVGHVMPKVIYPDGHIQYLCKLLPTPMDWIGRRFIPDSKWKKKMNHRYEMRFSGYDTQIDVPALSGCFMFLRVSVLERVSGFDERFFMYAEDVDLSRRIGEVSRTVYFPDVKIIHAYEKGSYKSLKLLVYHITSAIKYFNKWGWFIDSKRSLINAKALKA